MESKPDATIVSIKIGADPELRLVELSDGAFFRFRVCYLPPPFDDESFYVPERVASCGGLRPGEAEALKTASAGFAAESSALRLIARAEQTVFGMGRKLEKRGHDSAGANAAVSRLCEIGLLDDRRYARLWLESKIAGRGSSPLRLLAGLRARGIDREDADGAMREALDDDSELRLLKSFARRRQRALKTNHEGSPPPADDEDARRALKYRLKGEGFSSRAIGLFLDE